MYKRQSVLMVQDIANLIPLLVRKGGVYNVCDSYQPTFRDLETLICKPVSYTHLVRKSGRQKIYVALLLLKLYR